MVLPVIQKNRNLILDVAFLFTIWRKLAFTPQVVNSTLHVFLLTNNIVGFGFFEKAFSRKGFADSRRPFQEIITLANLNMV